ncbi:MAG: primosomal protein N' [Christensenellales bacterium]
MIAKVVVDISSQQVDKIFDYSIPSDLQLSKGDRVLVPFGPQRLEGFCIDITDKSERKNLKPVISRLDDFTCVKPEMLQLMQYMKDEMFIRYCDSLRLFLPPRLRGGKVRELTRLFVRLAIDYEQAVKGLSPRATAQRQVVEYLKDGGRFLTDVNAKFGVAAVNALIKSGVVEKIEKQLDRTPFGQITGQRKQVELSDEQIAALHTIHTTDKRTILLHGVTGSGKTMVYIECISQALRQGKSCIMLVPEIALTPQMLKNFRAYFGDTVAMIHSGLSDGERFDEWKKLHDGRATIVVGARSAIFAPVENVGLIIIDEEHDSSYVSDSNPRYKTIDIAQFRAAYNDAKIILGSATPSLESYKAATDGQYELVKMTKRISSHGMPQIKIVDMSRELIGGNNGIFSVQLRKELIETINRKEQAMIFLNRRGHSSFVMCRKCGWVAKCEDCDVSLTYHSADNLLKCHYCGKRYRMPHSCPVCGCDDLKYGKVGTQRVVEEIKKLLPDVSVLRMDNETTGTKTAYLDILSAFEQQKAQILVGTQMIAKGHDFGNVTLVGILDADISLYNSEYRSTERTYQLVTQIAGRAGRSEKAGKVYLQTYSPNHYVYRFAQEGDYDGFINKEINIRKATQFPPFSTIVRVLMSGEDEDKVIQLAKGVYGDVQKLYKQRQDDFLYLQAMKSPVTRIQNKYRYQIIARIKRNNEKQVIKEIYGAAENNSVKNTSIFIEVDPKSMS